MGTSPRKSKNIRHPATASEVIDLLESRADLYNNQSFIPTDPISVPHLFTVKEDIEIAAWLTAILSWGQRKTIIAKGKELVGRMGHAPHDFLMNAGPSEMASFTTFVHRTFNGDDCLFMLNAMKHIYRDHGGLETCFSRTPDGRVNRDAKESIIRARRILLSYPHQERSSKHIPDPSRGSAAKRINMFLRWMVRKDDKGVDFGIWKNLDPAMLMCPLDVHSGSVSRKLGLLTRKQNDWTAVQELTENLRRIDPGDPVRFDFALFGMGVFERI